MKILKVDRSQSFASALLTKAMGQTLLCWTLAALTGVCLLMAELQKREQRKLEDQRWMAEKAAYNREYRSLVQEGWTNQTR